MLQACHGEEFLREAVVAISASRVAGSSKAGRWRKSMSPIIAKHREVALLYYGKAIRSIKTDLATEHDNPRRVLIAYLLICCLEGMWGDSFNALAHARSGMQLLKSWLERTPHSKRHRVGIQSPAPEVIEDDIVQAFARLDIQMLTFIDVRTPEEHSVLAGEEEKPSRRCQRSSRSWRKHVFILSLSREERCISCK